MIEALHRLLPASAPMITGINNLTADNVLAALDKQGVRFTVNRLVVGDWDIESSEMTDEDILALLHINKAGPGCPRRPPDLGAPDVQSNVWATPATRRMIA